MAAVAPLTAVRKEYGDTVRAGRGVAGHPRGRGGRGDGAVRLRQVDAAEHDRRPGPAEPGSVVVHGEDLGRLNETGLALFRRRRIGMIFQFFNLIDDLPALDNVALAAQLTGTPAAQAPRGRWSCSTNSASPTAGTSTRPSPQRRRAPAGRGGSGADEPAGAAARRRADRRAGQPGGRAGDGPAASTSTRLGQTLLLVTHDQRLATRCASRLVDARGRPDRRRADPGAFGMSAVWRASRAAVRRRRLQTFVIGVVVLVSAWPVVLALGLLDVASGPFDRLFGRRSGAHVVATFDAAKVSASKCRRPRTVRELRPRRGRSRKPWSTCRGARPTRCPDWERA